MAQRGLLMQPIRTEIVKLLIRQTEPVTVPEIAKAIDVDYHPTHRHMKELQAMGWVTPVLVAEDTTRRYQLDVDAVGEHLFEYLHDTVGDRFTDLLHAHLGKAGSVATD